MLRLISLSLVIIFGTSLSVSGKKYHMASTPQWTTSKEIDSLAKALQTATDTSRVIILNKLSYQYMIASLNDKALFYGEENLQSG
jgi:hypothetical protein